MKWTALNSALFVELNSALDTIQSDSSIGAVVITGSSKAFAAGADIKEMKDKNFAEVYREDFLSHWTRITGFRKPIIAAVSGYAVSFFFFNFFTCFLLLSFCKGLFLNEGYLSTDPFFLFTRTAWRRMWISNDVRLLYSQNEKYPTLFRRTKISFFLYLAGAI